MTDPWHVVYRGHTIVKKRDFGTSAFLVNGVKVDSGWVVTKDGANVMPAAAWFLSIDDAIEAIDILMEIETSEEFWKKMDARPRREKTRRLLANFLQNMEHLGHNINAEVRQALTDKGVVL